MNTYWLRIRFGFMICRLFHFYQPLQPTLYFPNPFNLPLLCCPQLIQASVAAAAPLLSHVHISPACLCTAQPVGSFPSMSHVAFLPCSWTHPCSLYLKSRFVRGPCCHSSPYFLPTSCTIHSGHAGILSLRTKLQAQSCPTPVCCVFQISVQTWYDLGKAKSS